MPTFDNTLTLCTICQIHLARIKRFRLHPMLELRDIEKSYHSRRVLQKTSIRLEEGMYWVKGHNGSGKTTLLKMIAGLLPFEGDIVHNKISQKKCPVSYRQHVSWAEAEPLYPDFISGRDLVLLYRDIRKADQSQIDQLLELFDLRGYIDDTIRTYSAGMTKKLSLVLAFMGNCSLCVLDEPLITLDNNAFEAVCTYITETHKNKGTMFLLSSHQEANTGLMQSGKEIMISNQSISLFE